MADNLTPKEEFLLNPVTEHNITDAAIASFETNFKHLLKVTVPITPTQDLHGMPNPYPAGASVNLIPDGTDTENGYVAGQYLVTDGTMAANTNYYVSEYFQISENTVYTWSNRVNTSVTPAICFYDENKTFISGININGQYSQTFTSPVGAVYCRSSQTKYSYQESTPTGAAYQLEVGSTATAYRRYSNICSINGYAASTIGNANASIAFETAYSFTETQPGTGTVSPSNIRPIVPGLSFMRDNNATLDVYRGNIRVHKDGTSTVTETVHGYHIPSSKWTWRSASEMFYIECSALSPRPSPSNGNLRCDTYRIGSYTDRHSNTPQIFMSTIQSHSWLAATINGHSSSPKPQELNITSLLVTPIVYQLSVAETRRALTALGLLTKYEIIPITFTNPSTGNPMTVYHGSLTLNEDGSADLVSEYGVYILDGVERKATAFYSSGENHGFTVSGQYAKYITTSVITTWSSHFLPETYMSRGDRGVDNAIYLSSSNGIIKIRADAFDDEDSSVALNNFNSYLAEQYAAGTPVQVMYVLKNNNVQSYHFPNVGQLKAFLGQNNVWSDIGNVNVKYLTQHSETGLEYRGDRALELRRRAMIADAPKIHTTVGSSTTGGLASFKSYVKAPVKKIEIPFSPKQDFNGYDFPWPGGGYVQLFNSATTTYGSKIDVDGTLTEDANYFVSDFIPVTASTYYYVSSEMPVVVGYNSSKELLQVIKNSETGGAFQTPENCAYVRIQNYTEESDASVQASAAETAYMCAGSEENQWYPYENICPIEGYDGCNVNNGWDLSLYKNDMTINKNVSINSNGASVVNNYHDTTSLIPIIGGLEYECGNSTNDNNGGATLTVVCYDQNGVFIDRVATAIHAKTAWEDSVFIPTNAKKARLVLVKNTGTNAAFSTLYMRSKTPTASLIFNQSGDHSFLPIQEGSGNPSPDNIRPIHPGLTFTRDDDSVLSVYGGSLTVNADGTGSLVSKYISHTLRDIYVTKSSGSTEPWIYRYAVKWWRTGQGWEQSADYMSDILRLGNATSNGELSTDGYIYDNTATDADEVKEKYADAQIVYRMAEMFYETYTLSVAETNRALEALGLTQHIGPLYGGTITINPDGSADVVSEWLSKTVTGNDLDTVRVSPHTIDGEPCWEGFAYTASMWGLGQIDSAATSISDKFIVRSTATNATGVEAFIHANANTSGSYFRLFVKTSKLSDASIAGFKAWVSEMQPTLVWKSRDRHYTYHFSNLEQLKVWLGENNFWCDISDDITVKYLNRG